MKNVAIIAENRIDKRENGLKEFLRNKLNGRVNFVELVEGDDFTRMVNRAVKEADKILLVFDAQVGMNIGFAGVASILYNHKVRPVLLISNSDIHGVDIESAKNSLAEVWCMIDTTLNPWDYHVNSFYYSYERNIVDIVPEVKTDNIETLIKFLS